MSVPHQTTNEIYCVGNSNGNGYGNGYGYGSVYGYGDYYGGGNGYGYGTISTTTRRR